MPLTDLRTISLHHALRYTSRFGLNRSQGTYFYQIVQKSPPSTYLADLKQVLQPTPTSLLGRLLREACGTPPQLIPQEPVPDNAQSRRAWYSFEMKYGPSQTAEPSREAPLAVDEHITPAAESVASNDPLSKADPASTSIITPIREPATQPSSATLPAQLLFLSETPRVDIYQYPQPWTNTQYPYTSLIAGTSLEPQDLHYYSTGTFVSSELIQQEDMDCSPPSPILLSDVDMDMLTDIEPAPPAYDAPWSQWDMIPEYAQNTFVAPLWQPPVQDSAHQYNSELAAPTPLYAPSFHAVAHAHWDAAQNDLPGHSFVSAAPAPLNLNLMPPLELTHQPCPSPISVMSDPIQDAVEIRWQESSHRPDTPHPSSVATLLDEFERSLTLVADEVPVYDVGDHDRHPKRTSELIPSQSKVSDAPWHARLNPTHANDHPDNSPAFEREVTEPLEEGQDEPPTCFVNIRGPSGEPPPFELEPTEPLGDGQDRLPHTQNPPSRAPRRLTPPCARRTLSTSDSTTLSERIAARGLASTDGSAPAQASVQAGKHRAQLQAQLAGTRVLRPLPGRVQQLRDDDLTEGEIAAGAGVGMSRRRRRAVAARARRRRQEEEREEEDGEDRPERRERKKCTRFVEEDATRPPRRARASDAPHTSTGGRPVRSILRNKHAGRGPYQTAAAGRRASVP